MFGPHLEQGSYPSPHGFDALHRSTECYWLAGHHGPRVAVNLAVFDLYPCHGLRVGAQGRGWDVEVRADFSMEALGEASGELFELTP
jgi:hypothetical protein